jgi:hypothetical protein
LLVLTVIRVGSTWRVFSQTTDEGVHFLAGYQWLAGERYDLDPQHPPLVRALEAFPLWLSGARDGHESDLGERINRMFLTGGRYEHNLALIRCGNVLFVILAVVAVGLWARRTLPSGAAFLAAALVASLPPILAHGGLATTDMAGCAAFALAIVALERWLDTPTPLNAVLLGGAVGLGLVSKFSFIPFFGAAAIAITLVRRRIPRITGMVIGLGVALAVVTVVYRGEPRGFIDGIRMLQSHAGEGHMAYLFGMKSQFGWWYYFPVALLFKTPLPFLILAALGLGRRHLDAIVAAGVVMAIAMATPINIGVRHILPLYAPLAVLAAAGAWKHRKTAVVLCAWMFIGTAVSHPDYIPWFNELALGHGERILADSNLDWGQDVLRLRRICREQHIDSLAMDVATGAPLDALGLPPRRRIQASVPTAGWHAVSENYLAMGGEAAYARIIRYPMIRAGKSIRLYSIK